MELNELLRQSEKELVDGATDALKRVKLLSYERGDVETNRARLADLYRMMRECIASRDLLPIIEHGRAVARERYDDRFDLQEVQTAYNVLEEVIWKKITQELEPMQYPEAFGLVSTVLGAGKEALASEYVSLASEHHVPTIDFGALFRYGR